MRDRGFTLIELSIVLMVIGLLAGGILAGRDLIVASTIRAQIADIERLKIAIAAFRVKYDCLPGDCAAASKFLQNVQNGGGDGHISLICNSSNGTCSGAGWSGSGDDISASGTWQVCHSVTPEWMFVFQHLIAANLYSMRVPSFPANGCYYQNLSYPLAGNIIPELRISSVGSTSDVCNYLSPPGMMIGYVPAGGTWASFPGGHEITLGAVGQQAGNCGGLNAWEIEPIDRKIDDGLPLSGILVTASGNGNPYGVGYCRSNTGSGYSGGTYAPSNVTIAGRYRHCTAYIHAGF